MTGGALDALALLKEYGLAGVMAWLFWFTLRRMMASHDATVRGLREQLQAQAEGTRAVGDRFGEVMENHLNHAAAALARVEACLASHAEEERRWQERLVAVLTQIEGQLSR